MPHLNLIATKRPIIMATVIALLMPAPAALADIKADTQSVVNETENFEYGRTSCPAGQVANVPTGTAKLAADATIDQKIAQTFIVGFDTSVSKSVIADVVTKFKLGGIYFTGDADQGAGFDKNFFSSLSTAAGTPMTIASDEEGGQISNFKYGFNFPSAKQMATMSDADVENLGKQVGQAMAANGVNMDLAPVLDIDSGRGKDQNDIIAGYERAFSSDPATVAAKAGAFAKGLKSASVNVTFKHFPGLGFATGSVGNNTDKAQATSPDINTLKSRDLVPYKTVLGQVPSASVMLSNENVAGLDAGKPASVSSAVVNLLRGDYGFLGAITTDDLNVPSVTSQVGSITNAVSAAMKAGVSMPLFGRIATGDAAGTSANLQAIIDKVKADLTPAQIDEAVAKVLAFKNAGASASTTGTTATNVCCPPTGVTSGGTTTVPTGTTTSETIYKYFRDKGATAVGAAAVLGNFTDESSPTQKIVPGPDPKAVSGAGFHGIGQWGGSRWTGPDGLQAFASDQGTDWTDLGTQLKFATFELGFDPWTDKAGKRHSPPSWVVPAGATIKDPAKTDPAQAALDFQLDFEGCVPAERCGYDIRQREALAAFQAFGSYQPTGAPSAGTPAAGASATQCVGGGTTNTGGLSGIILSYAWPEYHPPVWLQMTPGYAAAREKAKTNGGYLASSTPGADCNEFVTMVVRDSGIDPKYNPGLGGTSQTLEWIQQPSSGWTSLGASGTIDAATLRPGDVAIKDGHTFIFVGPIPNFDTQKNSGIASASQNDRTGMAAGDSVTERGFTWFRKN